MNKSTFYKAANLHLLIANLIKEDVENFETPLDEFEYSRQIGDWPVEKYEKENNHYHFTDLEKSALAINALYRSNSELFIYLYKQGHAKTSPPSDPLLFFKQRYSSEVITTPNKLAAYLEAGGSLFESVEVHEKQNGIPSEISIMDILSKEKSTDIFSRLDKRWYFHIYTNSCFDEKHNAIEERLKIFNFHFLPHLFKDDTMSSSAPIPVELFQEMCDHHPLPLGWACALLSQTSWARNVELFSDKNKENDIPNPRQYFTEILTVFLNHVREPKSEKFPQRQPTEKVRYWDAIKKENQDSYTESDEIALLELMFSHFSKQNMFARQSQSEFLEKFKYYHKILGPKISIICSHQSAQLALGGMLTYSLLNYPTKEFEPHPIRHIKWKFIGSEWTERSFEYFSHSMNRYFDEAFDFEYTPTQPLNPNYFKYMTELANVLNFRYNLLNKNDAQQCDSLIFDGLPQENIETVPFLPKSMIGFMEYVDKNKEIKDYVQQNIDPEYSHHIMIRQMLKGQLVQTIKQVKEQHKPLTLHGPQRF